MRVGKRETKRGNRTVKLKKRKPWQRNYKERKETAESGEREREREGGGGGEREGQIELVGEREREQRGCLIQMRTPEKNLW